MPEKMSGTQNGFWFEREKEIPEDLRNESDESVLKFLDVARNNAAHTMFQIKHLLVMLDATGMEAEAAKDIELTYVASIFNVFVKKIERSLEQVESVEYELIRRNEFRNGQKSSINVI